MSNLRDLSNRPSNQSMGSSSPQDRQSEDPIAAPQMSLSSLMTLLKVRVADQPGREIASESSGDADEPEVNSSLVPMNQNGTWFRNFVPWGEEAHLVSPAHFLHVDTPVNYGCQTPRCAGAMDIMVSMPVSDPCLKSELYHSCLREFLRTVDLDTAFKIACAYITASKCMRMSWDDEPCKNKVHFIKKFNRVSNIKLGDCSYLSSCYNRDNCPFVHYTTQGAAIPKSLFDMVKLPKELELMAELLGEGDRLRGLKVIQSEIGRPPKAPAQWIDANISGLDLNVLGKFTIVMVDPPWNIHMRLPYQQISDTDIKNLKISKLQDDGVIFLWVTERAHERGMQCLKAWGYQYTDEIIWAKTNQINATIATGRTGHWLNHIKETCLVGIKGNPTLNCKVDVDVIVEKVRETSRKPDAIYTMIDRLAGIECKKLELFGRTHNIRAGWLTIGLQLPGTNIVDPLLKRHWQRYLYILKSTRCDIDTTVVARPPPGNPASRTPGLGVPGFRTPDVPMRDTTRGNGNGRGRGRGGSVQPIMQISRSFNTPFELSIYTPQDQRRNLRSSTSLRGTPRGSLNRSGQRTVSSESMRGNRGNNPRARGNLRRGRGAHSSFENPNGTITTTFTLATTTPDQQNRRLRVPQSDSGLRLPPLASRHGNQMDGSYRTLRRSETTQGF